jgi:allantoicase
MDFTDLVDLAQERLGGAVLYANDDFFASKDNLLKASKPIFIDGKYTDRGKWMDGWESRRRRTPGNDFAIIRLGAPGVVRGVVVDTAFFRGNFPEACSFQACAVDGHPDAETLLSPSTRWTEILAKSALAGDSQNAFAIAGGRRATHLRFDIFPDGGVARLRVFGDVVPDARWMGRAGAEVDLASVENGARVVACNDMFFGSRHNLVMPGRSVNMGDGWETKRSRRAGPDWVIVELGAAGTIERIEVDTNHFKGNAPESCAIQVTHAPGASVDAIGSATWSDLLLRTKLQPHTRHFVERELHAHAPATHARLQIFPDGGVSRLRLWGTVSMEGRERFGMARLASLFDDDLVHELVTCCGSEAWARAVAAKRPFGALGELASASDAAWSALSKDAQLAAFKAHPRIGERKAERAQHARAERWSEQEQAKVAHADQATLDALAKENLAYEAKFGHVFLICATGKSADEMLAALRARMANDAATEIAMAAEEQRKITRLRLEKLVHR